MITLLVRFHGSTPAARKQTRLFEPLTQIKSVPGTSKNCASRTGKPPRNPATRLIKIRRNLDTTPAGILIGAALFFSCLGGAERQRRTLLWRFSRAKPEK